MNIDVLIEKAKTDKLILRKLKVLAVESKLYELGASLRELETSLFPDTEETKKAKEKAETINLLLRMVEIKVDDPRICWLIAETIEVHRKRKDKFDLRDASKLETQSYQLFS